MMKLALILGVLLFVPVVMAGDVPGGGWLINSVLTGIGFAAIPIMVLVTMRSYAGWKDSGVETLKYLTYSFGLLTIGITFHAFHNMIMLPMAKTLAQVPTAWHYILTGGGEVFIFLSALMFLQSMRTPG